MCITLCRSLFLHGSTVCILVSLSSTFSHPTDSHYQFCRKHLQFPALQSRVSYLEFIEYTVCLYHSFHTHVKPRVKFNIKLYQRIKLLWICVILPINFGEGNGTPLQHSCLGNPMDRGAWRATVHGVAKSQTRLNN